MNYREIKDVFINGKCLKDILNNEKNIDLSGADLSYANLRCVNLECANLRCVNLECANLEYANLRCVNLSGADLSDTNLSYANLSKTDLKSANLEYANLFDTDLSYADLSNADLSNTDLRNVNLRGVDLSNANLKDITYNHLTAFYGLQCPEEGSFIGYKVADGKVIKLLITEDAKRSSGTSRKCRCSKAKVLSITNADGNINYEEAVSNYDSNFVYKVGEIVKVDNFDEDRWKVCTTGIHFFITRDEAIQYF